MIFFWTAFTIILAFGFVVFFGAPYVPSHKREVKKAFRQLHIPNRDDVLLDLGAGDGVVLRLAAQYCKRAVGYELNPLLVLIGRLLSRGQANIAMEVANMWTAPFPEDTTVIYVFGVKRDVNKLQQKITNEAARLRRPLRIISYGLELPDANFVKKVGAHYLYEIKPLHTKKP